MAAIVPHHAVPAGNALPMSFSSASSTPPPAQARIFEAFYAHPLSWLIALAAAHVTLRVAISPALEWDEAEQMMWSQQLALGYGAQPPLYSWLQWGVNAVLGPGVPALSLLKHTLLALAYVMMWKAGRELLGPRGAFWASASMLLLRIVKRPRPAEFAWLGLVCGAGLLSKYNFALVAAAMLAAALSVPESRRALLSRGWWWAPLLCALVVLPHAVWLASHLHQATAGTLNKMQIASAGKPAQGLLSLLGAWATTLAPWLLIALWAFGSAWWRRPLAPAAHWAQRLMTRYLILVGLALLCMALLAGVTDFKTHWMAPLLCMAPLAAFAARPELQDHPRANRYTGTVAVVALLVLAALTARPWVDGLRDHPGKLNHPLAELDAALRSAGYDGQGRIVTADHILGGMLRTRFPHAVVDDCMTSLQNIPACVTANIDSARQDGVGWLLIWRDEPTKQGWAEQAAATVPDLVVQSIELPFNMARADMPPARYRYSWHPAAQGTAP
jgi:4-amino-4-deoxy-L-arabinose transferase-like glycosyltransferase